MSLFIPSTLFPKTPTALDQVVQAVLQLYAGKHGIVPQNRLESTAEKSGIEHFMAVAGSSTEQQEGPEEELSCVMMGQMQSAVKDRRGLF